eukprot:TRINITY_DN7186_c1_g1_i1.p1 TRINITY_DN7186_c1_g1~~TRINITY_DN7186_c1_g1_i1.p1  ORF type:complete len:182 (-),score=5.18 TRINITY_DN7186_c1_g1_i1:440-985(-)
MMIRAHCCCMYLLAIAFSIVEVRSVSVAGMPVLAPAHALATTTVGSATAGIMTGILSKIALEVGEDMYWASAHPSGYVARGIKSLFQTMGALPLLVGADADALTWDCWKPILHDTTAAPSRGRLLADILNDDVISDVMIGNYSVFVRNRWNESWRIDPVILPWGQVAAHATSSDYPATLEA